MILAKQSTAITIPMGPFLDSTDGDTNETALTIAQADIRLSKNGGTWAQSSNIAGATHMENGYYSVPLDATDTNTLGHLRISIHVTGALAVWEDLMVLPANAYDALVAGTDTLEADLTQIGGVAQSATDLKDFADAGYDPATNKVQGVVLVDTTTTNTDMRGTDNALLASSAPANFGDLSITATTGLVDITQAAADKVWSTTTRTLTSFGTLVSDIWANATRTLTSLGSSLTQEIWDKLTSALTTVGSIGKLLVDDVDATISSRQPSGAVDLNADQSTVTVGTVNALGTQAKLDVNAEVDSALDTAVPLTPTADSINERIKAIDDKLPTGTISDFDEATDTVNLSAATEAQIDAIEVDTNSLNDTKVPQTLNLTASGNIGIDLANVENPTTVVNLSGTTVKTATDVEADTADIQSRLPAALVSGRMDADVGAISTSTTAADKLEASAETIETGAAVAGTLSTTQMTTDLTEATNDHYNGRIIIWTSGALIRQATDITAYDGTSKMLTFTAVTEAPSAGDTFVIV